MRFYVYVHSRPDGRPFYVGKGSGWRAGNIGRKRNPYHKAIVNKHGRRNIRIDKIEVISEAAAFEAECLLIRLFQEMGHRLANMTKGGEGSPGRPMSQSTKDALARGRIGMVYTAEQRRRISEFHKGRKRSPATCALLSAQRQGKPRPKHVIEKLVAYNTGRKLPPAHRDAVVAILRANSDKAAAWHRSPEGIAWHSINGKKAWLTRAQHENTCGQCGKRFKTFVQRTKFCSKRCGDQARWCRNKQAARLRSDSSQPRLL